MFLFIVVLFWKPTMPRGVVRNSFLMFWDDKVLPYFFSYPVFFLIYALNFFHYIIKLKFNAQMLYWSMGFFRLFQTNMQKKYLPLFTCHIWLCRVIGKHILSNISKNQLIWMKIDRFIAQSLWIELKLTFPFRSIGWEMAEI